MPRPAPSHRGALEREEILGPASPLAGRPGRCGGAAGSVRSGVHLGETTRHWPAAKIADRWISPTWSPDGRTLLFSYAANGSGVSLVPAGGSRLPALIKEVNGKFGGAGSKEYTPDGKAVVFVDGERLHVLNLRDSVLAPVLAVRAMGKAIDRPDELILVENFLEGLRENVKQK